MSGDEALVEERVRVFEIHDRVTGKRAHEAVWFDAGRALDFMGEDPPKGWRVQEVPLGYGEAEHLTALSASRPDTTADAPDPRIDRPDTTDGALDEETFGRALADALTAWEVLSDPTSAPTTRLPAGEFMAKWLRMHGFCAALSTGEESDRG